MNTKILLPIFLAGAVSAFAEGFRNLPDIARNDPPRVEVTDRVWDATPGAASICLWKDDKLSVVTITSDNCFPNDRVWWREKCAKYNLVKTWFVVSEMICEPPKSMGSWATNQALFEEGFDIQSHSATHRNKELAWTVEDDYKVSKEAMDKNLKNDKNGYKCMTIAYPGGGLPNDFEIARNFFIGARGAHGGHNHPGRLAYMNIGSSSGGMEMNETNRIPATIDPQSKTFRHWVSYHFHGINMVPGLCEKTEPALQYLQEHAADIWTAKFSDVIRYGQERDTATLKVSRNTPTEIALDLTCKMDPEYFDYPLTIKMCVPTAWSKITATQGGKPIESNLVEHKGAKFAFVQVVPGKGEAVIFQP